MLFLWSPVGRLAGGLNSFWILSFGRRRIIFLCVQHSQKYSGRWLLALCRRETLEGKVIVQYYDSPDGDVCPCAGKWSRCRRRRIFGRCRSRLLMRRVERRIPGRTEQSVGDRRFDRSGRCGLFGFAVAIHLVGIEQQPVGIDSREPPENLLSQIEARFVSPGENMGNSRRSDFEQFRELARLQSFVFHQIEQFFPHQRKFLQI